MNEITREVNKIMNDYRDDLEKLTSKEFKEVAQETVKELKSTSPKATPHRRKYAEGWRIKEEKGVGISNYIVHNATNYQLTHLLENTHVIRNKSGTYGRTGPGRGQIVHIAPAADKAADMLIQKLESKL